MSTPIAQTPPLSRRPRSQRGGGGAAAEQQPAVRPPHHVRVPTAEIAEKMQHLITLQNEQQEQFAYEENQKSSSGEELSIDTEPAGRRQKAVTATTTFTPMPSVRNVDSGGAVSDLLFRQNSACDPTVGKGTMFFAPDYSERGGGGGGDDDLFGAAAAPEPPRPSLVATNDDDDDDIPGGGLSKLSKSANHLNLAGYGTMEDAERQQPLQQQQQVIVVGGPGDQLLGGGGNPDGPHQQHDFHYANPDYHSSVDADHPKYNQKRSDSHCCLPGCLQQCLDSLVHAENWQRSFCFGAIDGMITGSGIVSTFFGLGLVDSTTSSSVRLCVVAFSISACLADSVCMALGHVWTTHVAASTQARDRRFALNQLQQQKADAKGRLVDMLLARGMLKIDAMSLADTLEGYPDLFASALCGEGLTTPLPPAADDNDEPFAFGGVPSQVQHYQQQADPSASHAHPESPSSLGAGRRIRSFWSSYGRLTDFEMDSDAQTIQLAVSESRQESLCMMLGFALFAIVPSVIYDLTCAVIRIPDSPKDAAAVVQPTSVAVFLGACVMWVLGVWKSRFVNSSWLVFFGIETVAMLLLCVCVAYGVGMLLSKSVLPTYELRIAAPNVPAALHSHDDDDGRMTSSGHHLLLF